MGARPVPGPTMTTGVGEGGKVRAPLLTHTGTGWPGGREDSQVLHRPRLGSFNTDLRQHYSISMGSESRGARA